jgi:DNA-binding XRE family transcriptional regulator
MANHRGKKFTTARELHERDMKDPEYRKAYEALEPSFALYEELIRARIEKKVTQKELAEKMGAHQSAIARFESGKTNPTLAFAARLAQALGVRIRIMP